MTGQKMLELLKSLEWCIEDTGKLIYKLCPRCNGIQGHGNHHKGCWLAEAIAFLERKNRPGEQ